MELKQLSAFIDKAKGKTIKRLVVAAAADEPVLEAVRDAVKEGIIVPILVGDKTEITNICNKINFKLDGIEIVQEKDPLAASAKAVEIIKSGKGDILMKGLVGTGPMLKYVLDKEKGLRKGSTLSHIAIFESPYYHKLIAVTDAAMNVTPDFDEKVAIINNAVEAMKKLGYKNPKIAVIGAVETVNPKMEATVHAAMLTQMNKRNQIKGCIIDGPLALDNAVSKEAAHHKGIVSEVAGDCDLIMTPDINCGNILYKSINFLGGGICAAVIMGATVPIVLTSRSDSDRSKLMSIAMAAAME
ncbi:MAG: phosphate butyryltransferase [Bacteroidetes bacterium GWF2_38_335]|nr:MAG: phosphate butyryltransferase [Bacteroidetes bacterium GWF2_38_335]OFY79013.1 MAG: phosphate butyryltransferase [Bacteroidetes bacterium RIFOXYA12_FULL_38_20]HBS86090.1 phosphate butyryltransferase [Bacteroidales bacterium]